MLGGRRSGRDVMQSHLFASKSASRLIDAVKRLNCVWHQSGSRSMTMRSYKCLRPSQQRITGVDHNTVSPSLVKTPLDATYVRIRRVSN
jgi:hypothetical protein